MRKIFFSVLMLMLLITIISNVHAQTPQEVLAQCISDLQKNPNDNALREKIIKHVQTMRTAPAIPEEAERFMARGTAATKNAKDANDFKDAVKEFEKATLSAPWLPAAYYNLGIARDRAGMYADAIKSLKLYLLASPNATDAKSVKNLIYEIEYKQEKSAKESSPAAIAERKRQEEGEFHKKIDGVRYKYHFASNREAGDWTIDIRGNRVIQGYILVRNMYGEPNGVWKQWEETTLISREFGIRGRCMTAGDMVERVFKGKISEDGYSLTLEDCYGTNTYRRER